jgi:hypothetical protein
MCHRCHLSSSGPDLSTSRGRNAFRTALRVAVVTSVVVAVVAVELTSRSGVSWRLVTFTYQANLLAAAYYTWALLSPRAETRVGLRGAVVLYVVVAGVIWNLFLTGHSMGYTTANLLLHVVVPMLAVADWLLGASGAAAVRWWQPFAWLAYPAAYGLVALAVLNRVGRRAPYFFLDPASVGITTVVTNLGLLAIGILGLGYGLLALTRLPWANA